MDKRRTKEKLADLKVMYITDLRDASSADTVHWNLIRTSLRERQAVKKPLLIKANKKKKRLKFRARLKVTVCLKER